MTHYSRRKHLIGFLHLWGFKIIFLRTREIVQGRVFTRSQPISNPDSMDGLPSLLEVIPKYISQK